MGGKASIGQLLIVIKFFIYLIITLFRSSYDDVVKPSRKDSQNEQIRHFRRILIYRFCFFRGFIIDCFSEIDCWGIFWTLLFHLFFSFLRLFSQSLGFFQLSCSSLSLNSGSFFLFLFLFYFSVYSLNLF